MNKVILIGNLTKDIDAGVTNSGKAYARFTLAVQRNFKNEAGEYEADFINCVAWGNSANLAVKYLSKGKKCAVVGSMQTRTYDAEDGTKRYATDVVANEIEFLTPKQAEKLEPIEDNDLPF